ncbi:flagellar basal body P-ring formation chaperone FlgA [Aliidiomarina sanyensis]|nr:flagellar basal body P-ring formation chaperone FlgA [Aliidiomarina sanyensis]
MVRLNTLTGWIKMTFGIFMMPGCLYFLAVGIAHADDAELFEVVQSFLYQQTQSLTKDGGEVVIEIMPTAARFGACVQPSPFFPNPAQRPVGRVAVGVRCGDQGQQVRYLQAQVTLYGHYVSAKRDILPGSIITLDMLEMSYGPLSSGSGEPLQQKERALGKLVRRQLRQGAMVQEHMLQTAPVIRRGERVQATVQGQGFEISREGEALDEGGIGDTIRVRIGAREILNGTVIGEGRVRVQ